ncbi:hypothetical protein EB796_012567 [Bugula neritina]|uniref:Uncharacterized protein n=1 Tax=Bugula neritina TaxID=10212 RepID=A0A7J7JRZ7_BUGNE|nr:hypothetical protein EB796_012567 [Bugula neritina]
MTAISELQSVIAVYLLYMCDKILNKATQIGLPCGHVIYCDRCSKDERTRTNVIKHYKSKCPYFNCGAPLTGTCEFQIN